LEIQQIGPSRDGFGEVIEGWVKLATVWGAIEPMTGSEQFIQKADQVVASRLSRIRIRKRSGLDDTRLRVKHGERIFDIQSITYDPTLKREIILIGEERPASGEE